MSCAIVVQIIELYPLLVHCTVGSNKKQIALTFSRAAQLAEIRAHMASMLTLKVRATSNRKSPIHAISFQTRTLPRSDSFVLHSLSKFGCGTASTAKSRSSSSNPNSRFAFRL